MLPLTFADKADYDKIQPDDTVTLMDIASLAPGKVRVLLCFNNHLDFNLSLTAASA